MAADIAAPEQKALGTDMEYERTSDGQIQADFARRAGQLLLQYEQTSPHLPSERQFEATLCVALLQSLLTICQESLRKKRGGRAKLGSLAAYASRSVLDEPALMGLEPDCVLASWTSKRGLTYREVFECLRNALCHPGGQGDTKYPRTGFITDKSGSGVVEAYIFTQSAWVNNQGSGLKLQFHPDKADDQTRRKLESDVHSWAKNYDVEGLTVELHEDGQLSVTRLGQPFIPVLRLRLGASQLRTLLLNLSDYLSSPMRQESLASV